MPTQIPSQRLSLISISCLTGLCLPIFSSLVTLAHNVKTNVDVGITFHIEPDHSPQAGQESTAWFALTKQGGQLIPLFQCDCELKVYRQGRDPAPSPLLTPKLIALSPEQYQNIPGANLVFPQPGLYQLELTGKPINAADFNPFKVSYPVTVKPGKVKTTQPPKQSLEAAQPINSTLEQASNNQKLVTNSNPTVFYLWLLGALASGLGIVLTWKLWRK